MFFNQNSRIMNPRNEDSQFKFSTIFPELPKNERAFSDCMVEALCANSATLRRVCGFGSGCLAAFEAAALGSRGNSLSSSLPAPQRADSSPAKGGVSVLGRNAGFQFALSARFVVWFGR